MSKPEAHSSSLAQNNSQGRVDQEIKKLLQKRTETVRDHKRQHNLDDNDSAPSETKEYATDRKKYRAGKRETAVKVYTVLQESKYLLIKGVPSVGVESELIKAFAVHGPVTEYRVLFEYETEVFTDVYWIKFKHLLGAQLAKRKMDDSPFYGETRDKMTERAAIVKEKVSQRDKE
ncbi:hypothetical protein PROFUN_05197 [Planoprotostelium fungivorum]|uniref:RRM domain-containing protein n=1 Tax=Planoprotostelium fungivorum TaxID=1890364 RepID=A0A2P6NRG6_9EUKA|nr:hypothetical protein PROFUN_05197 [Planoprotostelium fungivorum]